MLAYFFETAGKPAEAEEAYERAIKRKGNWWAQLHYAGFLTERERFEEVIDLLEKHPARQPAQIL